MPAGLPGGVCLARGSLLNRRGRPQHCSVKSVCCLAPSGQLGWGLGGSGCPVQHGSSGRTRRRPRGEGQGGGQTDFLPGHGPAQLRVCGWLLDQLQTPSGTSLEAPVAVSGHSRVAEVGSGQAHGMGVGPPWSAGRLSRAPRAGPAGLKADRPGRPARGAGRAAGQAGRTEPSPGSTGQPGLPGLREEARADQGPLSILKASGVPWGPNSTHGLP